MDAQDGEEVVKPHGDGLVSHCAAGCHVFPSMYWASAMRTGRGSINDGRMVCSSVTTLSFKRRRRIHWKVCAGDFIHGSDNNVYMFVGIQRG